MSKVVCFGELLLRLSPELNGEWINKAAISTYIGGAELNAALALSNWKIPVRYVTALPNHYLSNEILEYLAEKEIDLSSIVFKEGRIGIYILPQGADLKHTGVLYDRAHSSFSNLQRMEIDWDKVFKDVSWFHFSAICPAINEKVAQVCKEGLQVARQKGITISIDLNYRSKLWQYGKQPFEIMPELVSYANLIMGNIWAAEKMLGIPTSDHLQSKDDFIDASLTTSKEIIKKFPSVINVANTFRFDKQEGIEYYSTLYNEGNLYSSRVLETKSIVDKVGSGDTFMAGLIYGMLNKLPEQETIEFATAAAFKKLFIKGDHCTCTSEEIKKDIYRYA
jgi:Sugar kinases, ribokinase family